MSDKNAFIHIEVRSVIHQTFEVYGSIVIMQPQGPNETDKGAK